MDESLTSSRLESGEHNVDINGSLASYGNNTYQNKPINSVA